jgi:septum formation inhibitor-activating ATPase MinD
MSFLFCKDVEPARKPVQFRQPEHPEFPVDCRIRKTDAIVGGVDAQRKNRERKEIGEEPKILVRIQSKFVINNDMAVLF